jgi:hypothetical protein
VLDHQATIWNHDFPRGRAHVMLPVGAIGFEAMVLGDPTGLRDTATSVLGDEGFAIRWRDEWTADAKKGSVPGHSVLGWMAQRFHIDVQIVSGDPGHSLLRVRLRSLGFAFGGVVGLRRSQRMLLNVQSQMIQAFRLQRALVRAQQIAV